VLGPPAGLTGPELGTAVARHARRAEVDEALTAALAAAPAAAWAHALGRAGIPCVRVAEDEDVLVRRDLWDAGVLRELRRADGPPLVASGPPWAQANGSPPVAPTPGADTAALRARRGGFWHDA
jgi:crotonobetainyl-CoA:carnitine CoA-transferase CaiB-like acyl-CoA transferase